MRMGHAHTLLPPVTSGVPKRRCVLEIEALALDYAVSAKSDELLGVDVYGTVRYTRIRVVGGFIARGGAETVVPTTVRNWSAD